MLLAVALSFAILYLWLFSTGQCSAPPKQPPAKDGTEAPPTPGANGEETPSETPTPAEPATPAERGDEVAVQPESPIPEERITLQSDELQVIFSNRGAAVLAIQLKKTHETDREAPLDLIVPEAPDFLLGQIDLTGLEPDTGDAPLQAKRREMLAGTLRSALWELDPKAAAETPENDVVFVLDTESAIWRKRWIVSEGENRFDVSLRISRQARDTAGATNRRIKVLVAAGLLREGSTGASYLYPNSATYRYGDMTSASEGKYGLDPMPGSEHAGLRMLGARSHYFLSTWFSEQDRPRAPTVVRFWATGEAENRRDAIRESIETFYREVRGRDPRNDQKLKERIDAGVQVLNHAWMVVDLPSGIDPTAAEAASIELPFYTGPIDRKTLSQPAYSAVRPVIAYRAAFDILAEGLLAIYDFFRHLFNSAGLGVILMTVLVRGLMMPLSIRNQLGMRQYSRKIAKLKPELDKLKKKFGANPQKMREHQAKLYREHGVGFPTGCLMMFIQIPIFFALFSCLRAEYTLRNASFAWIHDLGGPDRLLDFGKVIVDLGILKIFSLNILPLLMVGLSLWQQRMMPKPADEQQAQQMRMMKWLPIVFAVILYNYTAALALYMVLSSATSIVESRIVRAKDPTPDAPGAVVAPTM